MVPDLRALERILAGRFSHQTGTISVFGVIDGI